MVVLAAVAAEAPGAQTKYESSFSDYKPFREQELRSWTEVNKEVADNPMGHAMGTMKGATGHAAHDTGAMKSAPAHDREATKSVPTKPGAHAHDVAAPKGKPGKTGAHDHHAGAVKEPAAKPTVAMLIPGPAPGPSAPSRPMHVTGTAVVQAIDKAKGRIKLTHEPIAALNWPRLTLFFRLKDRALADQVKEGERVGFTLERQEAGFVISSFNKAPAKPDGK